jgi:hypothetical protein
MRATRGSVRAALALLVLCACTASNPTPGTPTPTSSGVSASPPPTSGVALADGTTLPENCRRRTPAASQIVTFAAEGRVWALDPSSGELSCLLATHDPEPFLWGPQSDRVLLGGLRVAGWHDARSYPPSGVRPTTAGWGHPVGLAVVYAVPGGTKPLKFFMDTGETETLTGMPSGRYLAIAYHPTGLALGFILDHGGTQSIWLSTNEGQQPKRLVFTDTGTTFSDLTFSADGQDLIYMAHHSEGYSHLHTIDLAKPDVINSVWKGPVGEYVRTVDPSPDDQLFAVTEGRTCQEDHAALLIGGNGAERPLLPDVAGPTSVLGWIDDATVLVGSGGCGSPMSVYEVSAALSVPAQLLVSGVSVAASRAPAPTTPATLPREVLLDTGSGVG